MQKDIPSILSAPLPPASRLSIPLSHQVPDDVLHALHLGLPRHGHGEAKEGAGGNALTHLGWFHDSGRRIVWGILNN